jgi:CheY-like chemotaxis protein
MNADRADVRRVLVIDDDPIVLANVAEGLELLGGYEVIAASDGATGLEHFFAVRPDCVVVDIRMPGLNGYQFVRALRGDAQTVQTPLVVLSALVQDHEQLAGILAGADAYLIKPVRMGELVQAIERAMNLSAEERTSTFRDLSDL